MGVYTLLFRVLMCVYLKDRAMFQILQAPDHQAQDDIALSYYPPVKLSLL